MNIVIIMITITIQLSSDHDQQICEFHHNYHKNDHQGMQRGLSEELGKISYCRVTFKPSM